MNNLHRRTLVVALVALLSVGVVGAAFAAGTNKGKPKAGTVAAKAKAKAQAAAKARGAGNGKSDKLAAAAAYLGLTVAQIQTSVQGGQTLAQIAAATSGKSVDGLVAALVTAEKAELAAKVTAGKITQAQADAIIPTLTASVTAFVNGTAGAHGPCLGGRGGNLDAAVAYLGLTLAQVQASLQAGQTLAQIAGATSGKSVDGLVAALVTAEKAELAAAVTAGKITQGQADAIIPTLTAKVTALVNGTGGGHGGKHFGHRR
jgi:hypothetical protein